MRYTPQISIQVIFNKYDQIRRKIDLTWSHLLKKSLMVNFVFLCNESTFSGMPSSA